MGLPIAQEGEMMGDVAMSFSDQWDNWVTAARLRIGSEREKLHGVSLTGWEVVKTPCPVIWAQMGDVGSSVKWVIKAQVGDKYLVRWSGL